EARGARPRHGEAAPAEGHGSRALALLAASPLRARLAPVAAAGRAALRDPDLHGDLPAVDRGEQRELDDVLDVLTLLPAGRARARRGARPAPPAEVEERAEEIGDAPEAAPEVLEREAARRLAGGGAARARPAEAAERAQLAHLVVLLAL